MNNQLSTMNNQPLTMSNIDDFLADIEAKYQAKKRVTEPHKPTEKNNNLESMERKQSDSVDDLLKEFVALSYSSKLEAAIEYLKALNQNS